MSTIMRLLFVFCFIAICKCNQSDKLKLNQVLVLSRHNIRTPLTSNLEIFSPNKVWPRFNDASGKLTQKGVLMEGYMAEYFAEWLANEDFIKGCPKEEEVHIYCNTKSRTIDTAKAFAKCAFKSCNIPVHHRENIDIFDPVFHPIFHNTSENFIQQIINEMDNTIEDTDLTESYIELNKILDLEHSDICKQEGICDFSKNKTQAVYEEGEEANVIGPLSFGTQIVDNFLMSYYEGFPVESVAWGKITTDDQWRLLSKIIKQNQDVRFGSSGAPDFGKPLLKYMFDIFKNGTPKLTVLVGHDSNICVTLRALNFKKFVVKNQIEPFPIGGKIVFQKWSKATESYLKVEYVYPSFSQLRNGEKLSIAQPPEKVLLELNDCKMDDRGLCPWKDFVKLNF